MKKNSKNITKELLEIAKKYMTSVEMRGDLDTRGSDTEDFIEVSVWGIEAVLKAAYELGKASK